MFEIDTDGQVEFLAVEVAAHGHFNSRDKALDLQALHFG